MKKKLMVRPPLRADLLRDSISAAKDFTNASLGLNLVTHYFQWAFYRASSTNTFLQAFARKAIAPNTLF